VTDDSVVLDATVPAAACADLGAAMQRAINLLESLGMRPVSKGRFVATRRLLSEVAEADSYDHVAKSREMLSAMRLAMDLQQIWMTIADAGVEALVSEIRSISKGTLSEDGSRGPYQTQSQLFFGSLLAVGGLHTEARAPHQKGPDNRVRPLLLRAGVEVKRPEGEAGIERLFKRGLKQLDEANEPGLMAIDLSDCLREEILPPTVACEGSDPWLAGKKRFKDLKGVVKGLVRFPPADFRDISRVLCCVAFARGARWVRLGNGDILPEFYSAGWMDAYPHRGFTVWYWLGVRLLRHVEAGFARIGTVKYADS